jgi:tetratricopeptide (TPR) repeat protein
MLKTITPENPPPKIPPQASALAARYIPVVCIAACSVVVLHFLFLFVFPSLPHFPAILKRTWGFHFITYYSIPARIEFYLLAAIACVPLSNRLCLAIAWQLDSAGLRKIATRRKDLLFVAIAALSIPLFWLLRSKYAFLGDNFIRVDNIIRKDFLPDEFGTIWILHYFYAFMHSNFSLDGAAALRVFTYLCGGAFAYCALKLADLIGKTGFEKIAIFLFYFSFGTIYHFCGYIEIYSLPVVLIVAYLFTSLACMKGKVHYAVPALVLAAAILCHLISLIFVPSFLVVLFEVKLKKYPFFHKLFSLPVVIVTGAVLALVFWYSPMSQRCYPLYTPPQAQGTMAMFSFVHIWEYFNGLLLSCGPALIIAPACLLNAAKTKKRLSPELWFLIAASACILAGLFAINEAYGSGDWDIYSFSSLPVNLAAILLFFHCFGASELAPFSRYAVIVFLGFMVLHSAPWIVINASDKSIKRYEDCIMTDPGSYYLAHPAPMKIGMAFEKYNLPEKILFYYKMAVDSDSADPRNKYNYAVTLLRYKNQVGLATDMLTKLCDEKPGYIPPLKMVLSIAQNTNNMELLRKAGLRLVEIYRAKSDVLVPYFSKDALMENFRNLVAVLLNKKDIQLAEQVCNTLIGKDPKESENRYLLAAVYLEQGKYDQAISICRLLNKGVPQQLEPYLLASTALQKQNKTDLAVNVLNECISTVKDEKARNEAKKMLQQLRLEQQFPQKTVKKN